MTQQKKNIDLYTNEILVAPLVKILVFIAWQMQKTYGG